jgi:hypothetical protein
MRFNHGLLFWGLGFLSAGLVALAIQQNYLDRDTMVNAWRLWPLILVAIGLSIILSRTPYALLGTALSAIVIGVIVGTAVTVGPAAAVSCAGNGQPSSMEDHSGSFGAQASLNWKMNCGNMQVAMTSGSTWTASVGGERGPGPAVRGDNGQLRLTSEDKSLFNGDGQERWVVGLPSGTTYDADVEANGAKVTMDLGGSHFSSFKLQPNAADVRIDLSEAAVQGLDFQANAGSVSITTSGGTSLSGEIEVNAGSIKLCTVDGAAFRITASGTAFGTTMNGSGITQIGDTWESATYPDADAAHRITLTVTGNAGGFELNPSGGCK